MPVLQTRYGKLDEDKLDKLRDDFELGKLYDAVKTVETLRYASHELSEELHKVTKMADGVLQGDEMFDVESDMSLPELAEVLSSQVMEYQEAFDTIWSALIELEELYPDPDEELDDEA